MAARKRRGDGLYVLRVEIVREDGGRQEIVDSAEFECDGEDDAREAFQEIGTVMDDDGED